MRKPIPILTAIPLLFAACSGGGGEDPSPNLPSAPPPIAGTYRLIDSDRSECRELFASNIQVSQEGSQIQAQWAGASGQAAEGTVDPQGRIQLSGVLSDGIDSLRFACSGNLEGNDASLSCEFPDTNGFSCRLDYSKVVSNGGSASGARLKSLAAKRQSLGDQAWSGLCLDFLVGALEAPIGRDPYPLESKSQGSWKASARKISAQGIQAQGNWIDGLGEFSCEGSLDPQNLEIRCSSPSGESCGFSLWQASAKVDPHPTEPYYSPTPLPDDVVVEEGSDLE